jgi:hypothetical protein
MLSSTTVTVNVDVAVFGTGAAVSLAEHVTVLVPANVLPEAGEQATGLAPDTRSTAVGSG